MTRVEYKGKYLIAQANEIQSGLGWSSSLMIEEYQGSGLIAAEINLPRGVYLTRKDALNAALLHGKVGIDRGFVITPLARA